MRAPLPDKTGFTLIELSIVLVIIGLIVGGVLVGQDLIRQAELRSLLVDVQAFTTAANTFRGKYDCLPGDCATATTYFGTDSLGCPSGGGAAGTCNGDGNGLVDGLSESFRFWQQLGQAKLIKGAYSGIAGPIEVDQTIINTNVPELRISGVGLIVEYNGQLAGAPGYWDGYYGHNYYIGRQATSGGLYTNRPFLTAAEALALDKKYDDGSPALGLFRSLDPAANPGCADSYTAASANYAVSSPGQTCTLLILQVF